MKNIFLFLASITLVFGFINLGLAQTIGENGEFLQTTDTQGNVIVQPTGNSAANASQNTDSSLTPTTQSTPGGGSSVVPGGGSSGFGQVKFNNPIHYDSIQGLIGAVLKFVAEIGAIIAVLFIIYSGFLFVTAQGNEIKLAKAKEVFLWTVVGTAVLLGASVIATIISGTIDSILK